MAANNTTNPNRFSIGQAVNTRLESFRKARGEAQITEEMRFYKQVNESGMSTSDQLAFRESQIQKEKNRDVPDPEYIKQLETSIVDLRKTAKYEEIRNQYKQSQSDIIQGRSSYQKQLQLLRTQLTATADPTLRAEIQGNIQNAEAEISKAEIDTLDNNILFAKSDKTISTLDDAISKASTARAKALGSGDTKRASSLDLQIQALKQTKVQTQVDDKITQLSINKSRKASAVNYLQDLNDSINTSDSSGPITINGNRYSNEKEYWTSQRDNYIATNFFTDLNKEYTDFTNSVGTVNGKVPESVLKNLQTDFQTFAQKPEMAPYVSRLETTRTNVLSNALEKNANSIKNQYAIDNDITKAITSLDVLAKTYGINQDTNMQSIISDYAKDRGQFYNNLIDETNTRVAAGQSYSQAVSGVLSDLKTGKILAPTLSAKDVATQTPEQVLKSAPGKTADQLKAQNVPTPTPQAPYAPPTPAQTAQKNQQANQPQPTQEQLPFNTQQTVPQVSADQNPTLPNNPVNVQQNQTPAQREYVVQKGDTLSGISAKYYGKSNQYGKIFEANKNVLTNPSQIKVGQKLLIPT